MRTLTVLPTTWLTNVHYCRIFHAVSEVGYIRNQRLIVHPAGPTVLHNSSCCVLLLSTGYFVQQQYSTSENSFDCVAECLIRRGLGQPWMTAASSVAQAVIHPACAEQQLQQTASGISFRGLQARDFDQIKVSGACGHVALNTMHALSPSVHVPTSSAL